MIIPIIIISLAIVIAISYIIAYHCIKHINNKNYYIDVNSYPFRIYVLHDIIKECNVVSFKCVNSDYYKYVELDLLNTQFVSLKDINKLSKDLEDDIKKLTKQVDNENDNHHYFANNNLFSETVIEILKYKLDSLKNRRFYDANNKLFKI